MEHAMVRIIEGVLKSYLDELRQAEDSKNISRIANAIYREVLGLEQEIGWRKYYHHIIFRQLDDINKKQNDLESSVKDISSALEGGVLREIRSIGNSCPLNRSQSSNNPIELIVDGGPSTTAKARGKSQADKALSDWLRAAVEVIAIDPFLFKREKAHGHSETPEEAAKCDVDYADELLDIFGAKKSIKFIYKGNPSKSDGGPTKVSQGVANRIADQLAVRELKATFHVVEDLHDRVWLKLDAKKGWQGKVIGTSRGGIGRRPTYIIDMTQDDVRNYRLYVDHLISVSQQSHERPIDFKKIRRTRASPK